jgi:hypothetical protein
MKTEMIVKKRKKTGGGGVRKKRGYHFQKGKRE